MMTYSLLPNVFNEIADPAISFQFHPIPHYSAQYKKSCVQFRTIACNGIPIGNPTLTCSVCLVCLFVSEPGKEKVEGERREKKKRKK